jgi:hypothetical protein
MNDDLFWHMVQSISSRDQYIHHLYSKGLNSHKSSREHKYELMETLKNMMEIDEVFVKFLNTTISSLYFCRD